jgi:hypothetical protein
MDAVQAAIRARRAADINQAATAQLNYADFRVPVDTGALKGSLKQTVVATEDSLRAEVQAGGTTTVGGEPVTYAPAVNFGSHHISSLGNEYDIAPDPFWTEAEDVGRESWRRLCRIRTFEGRQQAHMQTGKRTSAQDFETFEESEELDLFGTGGGE